MRLITRIDEAYNGRKNATNEAAWVKNDPTGWRLLMVIEELVNG